MQSEGGVVAYSLEKEMKLSLILSTKLKSYEYLIWYFLKFQDEESSLARSVMDLETIQEDLESPGW